MVRWTTVPHPYTTEQAEAFLGGVPEGVARWAYVVDGRYAGNVELRAVNGYPEAILGYSTAPWASGAEKAGYTYDGPLPELVDQRGHLDELAGYMRFAGDAASPKSTSIAP